MGKIFGDVSYPDYVPQYVGQPVEEIKALQQQSDKNYLTGKQAFDIQKILMANTPALKPDQEHVAKEITNFNGALKDIVASNAFDKANILVDNLSTNFKSNPAIIKAGEMYQKRKADEAALNAAFTKGDISKEDYDLAISANKDSYKGIGQPDEHGFYNPDYNFINPPKSYDFAEGFDKMAKHFKESGYGNLSPVTVNGIVTGFKDEQGKFLSREKVVKSLNDFVLGNSAAQETINFRNKYGKGKFNVDHLINSFAEALSHEEISTKFYNDNLGTGGGSGSGKSASGKEVPLRQEVTGEALQGMNPITTAKTDNYSLYQRTKTDPKQVVDKEKELNDNYAKIGKEYRKIHVLTVPQDGKDIPVTDREITETGFKRLPGESMATRLPDGRLVYYETGEDKTPVVNAAYLSKIDAIKANLDNDKQQESAINQKATKILRDQGKTYFRFNPENGQLTTGDKEKDANILNYEKIVNEAGQQWDKEYSKVIAELTPLYGEAKAKEGLPTREDYISSAVKNKALNDPDFKAIKEAKDQATKELFQSELVSNKEFAIHPDLTGESYKFDRELESTINGSKANFEYYTASGQDYTGKFKPDTKSNGDKGELSDARIVPVTFGFGKVNGQNQFYIKGKVVRDKKDSAGTKTTEDALNGAYVYIPDKDGNVAREMDSSQRTAAMIGSIASFFEDPNGKTDYKASFNKGKDQVKVVKEAGTFMVKYKTGDGQWNIIRPQGTDGVFQDAQTAAVFAVNNLINTYILGKANQ